MSEITLEFAERILAVMVMLVWVPLFVTLINTTNSAVSATKEYYANNDVYSEANLAVTDESEVEREELMAILLRCPSSNLMVRDDVSNYVLQVEAAAGTETTVQIKKMGTSYNDVVDSWTYTFGKDSWNVNYLDLAEYLQADTYTVSDVTYSDGTVKSILYYGKNVREDTE